MPVNVKVRSAVREGKALAAAGHLDEAEAVLIRLTHEPVGSPEDRAAVADLLTAIATAHGVDTETFLQNVFLQKVDEATTLARTDPEAGLQALDAILASADPERSTQRLAIADALYNRAALLRQSGRREEAIRDYRRTVALFAGDADPDVQFWVALALVNHAQYLLADEAPRGERDVAEGLRLLEQLMTDFRDSKHPQIRERLARGALFRVSALTELGRRQEASAVLAQALRMLSGDPAELRAPLEEFRDTFLPAAEGPLTEQVLKLGGREWTCVLADALDR
jgi:tetratricopeptide (TPR) repeat protein